MESFLNRYRNITVLLLVIFAQLLLLAVQVRSEENVPIIRTWTVTAVTPLAKLLESVRSSGFGFLHNYVLLHNTTDENRHLRDEVGRLKMENIFLKNELNTADRAAALQVFQQHTQSKTLAATIIGTGSGSNSKVLLVDRGSSSGVERGMAVVTPDGIVGKVVAVYPTASQIVLLTDPDFAAGVISQKGQVRGTLKGMNQPMCRVDYVPIEEKVEVGEWFYTSGDDRLFPRGFPVGVVRRVQSAQPFQEILVEPSGLQHGFEDVLIVIEGVHQAIPPVQLTNQQIYMAPPPPDAGQPSEASPVESGSTTTDADRLHSIYKAAGEAQSHTYGEGFQVPDFTKLPASGSQTPAARATAPATPGAPATAPGTVANTPPNPAAKTVPTTTPKPAGATPPVPTPAARQANQAAGAQPTGTGH